MSEERKAQEEPRPPLGTLACLAAGFEIVARHPGVMMIPLLLDLFLWLGPRLSLAPIFQSMERLAQMSVTAASTVSPDAEETYLLLRQMFADMAQRFNLFSSLEPAPLLGVPTLMSARMTLDRPFGLRPEMVVTSVFTMMGWFILLSILGLGLNALYLAGIGRRVLEETESPLTGPRSFIGLWGQLLLLTLILMVALFMFSITTASLLALLSLLSLGLVGFLLMLVFSVVIFAGFHLVFVIPGMVQLRRSPLRAIQESVLLTRADFLNVTFLVVLIIVISNGFNVVWSLPDPATWMNLIGIAGHAFVSAALTATLFIFYQERLGFLSLLQKALAAQETAVRPVIGE